VATPPPDDILRESTMKAAPVTETSGAVLHTYNISSGMLSRFTDGPDKPPHDIYPKTALTLDVRWYPKAIACDVANKHLFINAGPPSEIDVFDLTSFDLLHRLRVTKNDLQVSTIEYIDSDQGPKDVNRHLLCLEMSMTGTRKVWALPPAYLNGDMDQPVPSWNIPGDTTGLFDFAVTGDGNTLFGLSDVKDGKQALVTTRLDNPSPTPVHHDTAANPTSVSTDTGAYVVVLSKPITDSKTLVLTILDNTGTTTKSRNPSVHLLTDTLSPYSRMITHVVLGKYLFMLVYTPSETTPLDDKSEVWTLDLSNEHSTPQLLWSPTDRSRIYDGLCLDPAGDTITLVGWAPNPDGKKMARTMLRGSDTNPDHLTRTTTAPYADATAEKLRAPRFVTWVPA
jgi:hypothetical protein